MDKLAVNFSPMGSSSDSDVICRSRHHGARSTRRTYDSESDVSSDYGMSPAYSQLFYSIFGNGDEYSYIYEDEKSEEKLPSIPCYVAVDDCYAYISKEVPFEGLTTEIVSDLLSGYSPEYISFYMNTLQLKECYYIQDLIKEYKKQIEQGENKTYKGVRKDERMPGLLSVSEYIANVEAGERIHEPHGSIASGNEWDDAPGDPVEQYSSEINKIASHPVFIAAVRRATLFEKMGVAASKDQLTQLYTTGYWDESNEVRSQVIEEAFKRVKVPILGIENQLKRQGFLSSSESEVFHPTNISLQTLSNAICGLRGPTSTYAGIFLDRSTCWAVTLGDDGRVRSRGSFSSTDLDGIRGFLSQATTVCLTSNTRIVRPFLTNMETPMLYLPKSFSLFSDEGAYSIPCNIARAVQNPLVYFSRFALTQEFSDTVELYRRAISLSAVFHRPDWNLTHCYLNGYALFEVLGIRFPDTHFDYRNISSLEDLKHIFDDVVFANIGTFFSLTPSTAPLDVTHVHPKDYSWATVLCKGAYQGHGGVTSLPDEDVVRSVLSTPRLLHNMNLPDDELLGSLRPPILREMLLGLGHELFSGATDKQVFCDVVPLFSDGAICDGVVAKEGPHFYLVEIEGAVVYIPGDSIGEECRYSVNQIVKVRIDSPTYRMLSYSGTILEKEQDALRCFAGHRLFRVCDQKEIENKLREEGLNVLVRPSSTPSHCVVVCRVEDDLFFSYKLEEGMTMKEDEDCLSLCYRYEGDVYESIDDFIAGYVNSVFSIVRDIKRFKHYHKTVREAVEYLKVPGEYAKYALCLSRSNPGFLEFLYSNKRALAKIGGSYIQHREKRFVTVEEFINFAKRNFN